MRILDDDAEDCHICVSIIQALSSRGVNVSKMRPAVASVCINMESLGGKILGRRNNRSILVCSKHNRQLVKAFESVIEESSRKYE